MFALKVFHAALLQDPGLAFERGKALPAYKKTVRKMKVTLLPENRSECIFTLSLHELKMMEHIKPDVKQR